MACFGSVTRDRYFDHQEQELIRRRRRTEGLQSVDTLPHLHLAMTAVALPIAMLEEQSAPTKPNVQFFTPSTYPPSAAISYHTPRIYCDSDHIHALEANGPLLR